MARGFKVADIYASLTVDKDLLRQGVRDIPAAVGPDADRAGRELGERVTRGIAGQVEALSAKLTKARREESKAADAVKLAELRLNEAREKGGQKASTLLALEQRLAQSNQRLADANDASTKAASRHAEAQRKLSESLKTVGKDLGPAAQRAGDDAGGKLALGMRMSIIRNSPLIVAAVGAGLAAGGPAVLTAATALFAGVGIVSAAQSERVQSAWLGTWQRIKAGAVADAAVIEPTLIRLADRVGDRFDAMRPKLRGIFEDAAPQIEVFSDGLLDLTENALPGFERAVAGGMPVTRGFADFLAKVGTGLTDFLDRITAHGPAAGQVWSQLGDIMGELLPILGELLGQGAELASIVLPLLSGSLGIVLRVADALGPALPAVAVGIGALKIAQAASGWVGGLSLRLGDLSKSGGVVRGAMGAISSSITPTNAALGALGVGVGLYTAAVQYSDGRTRDWADALTQGGAAARLAREEMSQNAAVTEYLGSGATGLAVKIMGLNGALRMFADDGDKAEQASREFFASLDPLAQAQAKVAQWTSTLSDRLQDESATTGEVEAAKRRLAYWQREAARLADEEARAIRGVTEAMVEQADQSRALVDASFAYEESLNGVEDALANLKEARKAGKTEEIERAELALAEAYDQQAAAAGRVAQSGLPEAMDDSQKAIIGAKAELDELNRIAAKYELPPALEAHRLKLEQITGQADGAMIAQAQLAAAVGELGFAVSAVPGEKTVMITAPTDELRAKLDALGFTIIELPNGDIEVVAETDEAKSHLNELGTKLIGLNNTTATPKVVADDGIFSSIFTWTSERLKILDGSRPTPTANIDDGPFIGVFGRAMTAIRNLAGQRPSPAASLQVGSFNASWSGAMQRAATLNAQRPHPLATLIASTSGAEGALNYAARDRYSRVMQTVVGSSIRSTVATGGKIGDVIRGFAAGGSPQRRFDGKLIGPGGPLDDLIGAITDGGEPIRVANTEWVVKGSSSAKYGDRRMRDVNDGTALVLSRDEQRRFADGGSPAQVGALGFEATALAGRLSAAFDQVIPNRFYDRMVEAVTVGVEGSLAAVSPALTASVTRGAPSLSRAVLGGSPFLTAAVAAAGPSLAASIRSAAPSLGDAIRAAAPAATRTAAPAAAPARPAVGGTAAYYDFDERRQNDRAYMSWWQGLLSAGWKGNPNDGRERLYRPRARGGRVWPGEDFLVGEEGKELVRFDAPGTVVPARETRQLLDGGGLTLKIENLIFSVQTPLNMMDARDIKRAAEVLVDEIEAALVKRQREYR